MGRLLGVLVLLVALVGAAPATAATASTPPPPKIAVLLVGDSLTHETGRTVSNAFMHNAAYKVKVIGQVGHAPCDFIAAIQKAMSTTHYAFMALETAGNSQSTCMREPQKCVVGRLLRYCPMPIGSPEYLAKYRTDLNAIAALARSVGTPLTFISPPPVSGEALNRAVVYSTIEPQFLADNPDVVSTDAPRAAVSNPDGSFAAELPCLASETAADGCVDGMIPVRAPDGLHFCPTGLQNTCPEYSSGAVRFGTAEVALLFAGAGAT